MATAAFEIPLSPHAQFFVTSLAGVNYKLTFRWNDPAQIWMMDIADSSGNPIISGIPLITGADLLAQYGYLNFGGALIVQSDVMPDAVPTLANLGKQGHLYFVPTANL
jgi:hypothetical protein